MYNIRRLKAPSISDMRLKAFMTNILDIGNIPTDNYMIKIKRISLNIRIKIISLNTRININKYIALHLIK